MDDKIVFELNGKIKSEYNWNDIDRFEFVYSTQGEESVIPPIVVMIVTKDNIEEVFYLYKYRFRTPKFFYKEILEILKSRDSSILFNSKLL